MRLPARPHPAPADVVACVALTVAGVVISLDPEGPGGWLDTATVPALTVPLLWRRTAPLGCAAALVAGAVVSGLPTFDQTRCGVAIPAALLAAYAVGARERPARALAGLALALTALAFVAATDGIIALEALLLFGPLVAAAWGAGRWARAQEAVAAELAARSAALERRRRETAALRVTLERIRLAAALDAGARDRVDAIVADAARGAALPADGDAEAGPLFARIEETGRATLDEMRSLLGALRSDAVAGRAPAEDAADRA